MELVVDANLVALKTALTELDQDVDDAARIDRIRLLEEIKSAAAAAQVRETAAFMDSQRTERRAAGVKSDRVDRGLASQVALARRISPHQAQKYVGWSKILTTELPATFTALAAGETSECRALIVAKESAFLSREDRADLDAELGPRLDKLGDRKVEAEAKTIAYRLDPAGFVKRLRHAENERHVSLRPAPDSMTRLTALLPVKQGVACLAALTAAAGSARAAGDERGKGQVMADTLVQRITGQTDADQVPVHINLIMTDQALFNTGTDPDEPAVVLGDGVAPVVVPAELARRAAADASGETGVFLRRLYRHPTTGQLAAMDSTARDFTDNQRLFLLLRDQFCRTPYCGAPIRHDDHVRPAIAGGPTSIDNGAGLCEACNYAKQAEGWQQTVDDTGEITTITPTGHRYRSRPPDPPRADPDPGGIPVIIDVTWLHKRAA